MKRYLIMLAATFFMLQAMQVALAKEPVKAYQNGTWTQLTNCLLYTSPSPRDRQKYRMPSSA